MRYEVECPWDGWQIVRQTGKVFDAELYRIVRAGEEAPEEAVMLCYFLEESGQTGTGLQRDPLEGAHQKSVQVDGGRMIYVRMEPGKPLELSYGSVTGNEDIRRMGMALSESLAARHRKDQVHGAVCPGNIWVTDEGQASLTDIRILMEKTGEPDQRFQAPETAKGRPCTPASDIYSLGLVLYWLLNERRMPFLPLLPAPVYPDMEADSLRRRLDGERLPPPRHGSRELKAVVCKACEPNPRKRYKNAEELLKALKGVSAEEEVQAGKSADGHAGSDRTVHRDPPREKPKREPRKETSGQKGRGGILPLLAVLAAAVLAGGWFLVHIWEPATCAAPETCRICGKTRGEALEHQWGEAACGEKPLCGLCGAEFGEIQAHEWLIEDCELPWSCLRCGLIEENGTHSWVEATCQKARHCPVCGAAEGETVDHSWEPATRDLPQRCSVCGLTEGTALTPGLRYVSSNCAGYTLLNEGWVDDTAFMLAVGDCAEFVGAFVTVTDAGGAAADLSRFVFEWEGKQVTVRVLEGLEPGIYVIRYGDTGIWSALDYGYIRELYHYKTDTNDGYFLVSRNWKNGRYLTAADTAEGRVLETTQDQADVLPVSIKNLMGGEGRDDYESRIYWYCPEATVCTVLRTYELDGKYLASDADGVVYLSDTLTEECYWTFTDRLVFG